MRFLCNKNSCFQCRRAFIYPFLYLYLVHFVIGCVELTLSFMFLIREADGDLGAMILYYTIEFFIVLFHIYTWACVYSLIKALRDVETSVAKRLLNKVKVGYLEPIRYQSGTAA
nr:unnamed protein product [Callosobruchus analis]